VIPGPGVADRHIQPQPFPLFFSTDLAGRWSNRARPAQAAVLAGMTPSAIASVPVMLSANARTALRLAQAHGPSAALAPGRVSRRPGRGTPPIVEPRDRAQIRGSEHHEHRGSAR
jgi:hypothetical protein